jgi:hypothetical protein
LTLVLKIFLLFFLLIHLRAMYAMHCIINKNLLKWFSRTFQNRQWHSRVHRASGIQTTRHCVTFPWMAQCCAPMCTPYPYPPYHHPCTPGVLQTPALHYFWVPIARVVTTASDCHGFQNPHGLQVGYAGVRVQVGFQNPRCTRTLSAGHG